MKARHILGSLLWLRSVDGTYGTAPLTEIQRHEGWIAISVPQEISTCTHLLPRWDDFATAVAMVGLAGRDDPRRLWPSCIELVYLCLLRTTFQRQLFFSSQRFVSTLFVQFILAVDGSVSVVKSRRQCVTNSTQANFSSSDRYWLSTTLAFHLSACQSPSRMSM